MTALTLNDRRSVVRRCQKCGQLAAPVGIRAALVPMNRREVLD